MAGHDPHDGHSHGDQPSHEEAEPDVQLAHRTGGHAEEGAHTHDHFHDDHDHEQGARGLVGRVLEKVGLAHSHSHLGDGFSLLETSARGIWAVKVSLLILTVTAVFQIVIVALSGSVALLADTIHNFTDALTAIPLWLAFLIARRPPSRRFTHGYGRMEDLAGLVIVAVIFLSAVLAGYESYRRILDPRPLDNTEWVMVAAIVGFLGNEAVAILRTRVGREIGSAALVADGQHARVDGLTSLAVLAGAIGVLAGAPIADPLVGAVITIAILFIAKDAAVMIWHRLMDAVDPELLHELEHAAEHVIEDQQGVSGIGDFRVRWLGHALQAELSLTVDEDMSTKDSHRRAEVVRHALFHANPQLASVIVHVEPDGHGGEDPHSLTAHHRAASV